MAIEDSPSTRLETLFHEALEIGPGERHAFVSAACGGDLQLRDQVLSLIAAFESEGNFLETPAMPAGFDQSVSQALYSLGQVLGHYQIIEMIGQGGMGDVYLAVDQRLGRKVALKLLPTRFSKSANRLARFWMEAKTTSSLNHPNIVTVHEFGEQQGLHYIATEYVAGSTVRQLLAGGPLAMDEALSIALQTAGGLAAAHAKGIIHRDLKPENIMVRPDGYAKILDFGLAKLAESDTERPGLDRSPTRATAPGILFGTVGYMSPEQARGADLDTRSDLFSLGAVLCEMMTGQGPFTRPTPSDTLAAILHEEPLALMQPSSPLPPEWVHILSKLLAKDREFRYPKAEDLIVDLKKLREQIASPTSMQEPVAVPKPEERKSTSIQQAKSSLWRSPWASISALVIVLGVLLFNIAAHFYANSVRDKGVLAQSGETRNRPWASNSPPPAASRIWDTRLLGDSYRVVTPDISVQGVDPRTVIGITVWKMREYRRGDPGQRLLVHGPGKTRQWTLTRVSAVEPLQFGDKVRIGLEIAREGYVYVIDREILAEGGRGDPYLIFPTLRIRGGNNHVFPGQILELPGRDDDPPYYDETAQSGPAGEALDVIVSPDPLQDFVLPEQSRKLPEEQYRRWREAANPARGIAEMKMNAAVYFSKEEMAAGRDEAARLSAGAPRPRTLFYSPDAQPKDAMRSELILRFEPRLPRAPKSATHAETNRR